MQNSIVRGFKSVLRFGGRDTRSQFWPYAGVAVALYLIIGCPVVSELLPDDHTMSPKAFDQFFLASLLMGAALVVILAAAVARRLHDSGLSGYWGLMPLPFVVYGLTAFYHLFPQFEAGEPDMPLFYSFLISNSLYFVAVVLLIVLLARRSVPGPNRLG